MGGLNTTGKGKKYQITRSGETLLPKNTKDNDIRRPPGTNSKFAKVVAVEFFSHPPTEKNTLTAIHNLRRAGEGWWDLKRKHQETGEGPF